MATAEIEHVAPASAKELAETLAAAAERKQPVRVRGGGTKFHWGVRGEDEPALELSTEHLDGLLEHNAGDMTAVLEAGMPLHRAQQAFAAEGQMLALDPPDPGGAATLGGVVAAADSGPLRSRYGAARDLVLGVRVALSDGTLAQAGGKVIKNVAGYDLAKLFAGSLGTLGAIVQLSVRLHPLPPSSATAVGGGDDPAALAAAASALAHAPLEQYAFDVRWRDGRGAVLSRFAGAAAGPQAEAAAALLREAGLDTELVEHDDPLWDAQREGQRSDAGTVVRVSALQTQLADVLRAAQRHDALLVGRAGLGLSWLRLEQRGRRGSGRGGRGRAARALPRPLRRARRARRGARRARSVGRDRPGRARADAARQGALRSRRRLRTRGAGVAMPGAYDDTRAPQLDLIDDCVHCGFCLPTCPTYSLWGEEMDSPRGRIVLMKAGHEEGATLDGPIVEHLDRCLGCMACVTACPSGRAVRQADRGRPRPGRAQRRAPARRARLPAADLRAVHAPGPAARQRARLGARPPPRPRPTRPPPASARARAAAVDADGARPRRAR